MRNALKFSAFIGIVLLSSSLFIPFGEFYGQWSWFTIIRFLLLSPMTLYGIATLLACFSLILALTLFYYEHFVKNSEKWFVAAALLNLFFLLYIAFSPIGGNNLETGFYLNALGFVILVIAKTFTFFYRRRNATSL